jgi:hypothetical protein
MGLLHAALAAQTVLELLLRFPQIVQHSGQPGLFDSPKEAGEYGGSFGHRSQVPDQRIIGVSVQAHRQIS